ncbi:DUF3822 family protein [Winogradskyella echinorum]|uniref:DUF3822 family protein n=1 Tax=Winogradskyella echinorum TaxID=538189 RepID=A0ABR6Y5G8_9FLAO|nr:DUF3822 family protein [Winogradskyella echinorum]MBC3847946.1 DUF3822 family protein [Winogradskyella echinorum]MBC5752294.1 DUF3822 family protein [Winogradskyella echinorum]
MNANNIKELSIQINLNGLSFCILNKETNTIEFLKTIAFANKLNPANVLNHLKAELSSNTVFSEDFDAVLVIHQNELSTLVPKSLYDEKNKADYLKFNSKILRTDFITEDEITANDSINVYVPYVNINNYIFDTFGEFVYKHASSVLIDTILEKENTSEDPIVYINSNKNTIEVLVVDKGQLQLFNVFEYHSKEDFIYYLLFVFEQLKLDVETTHVKLSGAIDKEDELYTILYTYVRHIDLISTDFKFKISNTITTDNLHQHYLILNSF